MPLIEGQYVKSFPLGEKPEDYYEDAQIRIPVEEKEEKETTS